MSTYRISQLADQVGVPATTLRFYEREGLLPAVRTSSGYALGVEVVDPAGAICVADDQPSVLEHPQVLRYRRPADRQLVGELLDRAWSAREEFEDGAPGRVTEQTQPAISVSLHER